MSKQQCGPMSILWTSFQFSGKSIRRLPDRSRGTAAGSGGMGEVWAD